MKWYQDYDKMLQIFEKHELCIDETVFYYNSDPKQDEHYIGYLPEANPKAPYWAGLCDVKDGCSFTTAKELFEAKIYNGRSIKDLWDEIVIIQMSGINMSEWIDR